jgi:predicted O-linked N-acetylglucosamine transferase (SPINDLY family)
VYAISEPFYNLHPGFDDVLFRIMSQDHLSHMLFIDSYNSTAQRNAYAARLKMAWNESFVEKYKRIAFMLPPTEADHLKALSASHMLLDPFPVSGYYHCLLALSLGVPVVTLPSTLLSGRQCLALYTVLDYKPSGLVVTSEAEYVKAALALAHSKPLRETHKAELLARKPALFDEQPALQDWTAFLSSDEIELVAAA